MRNRAREKGATHSAIRCASSYLIALLTILISGTVAYGGQSGGSTDGIEFTVLHGGNRYGKIESCGCSQIKAGGIDREAKLIADMRKTGKSILAFEPGGLLPPTIYPERDTVRLDYLYQILATMQYDAINVGPGEIKLGLKRLKELEHASGAHLVSANVVDEKGNAMFSPYRLVPITAPGGKSGIVGVTGVTATKYMAQKDTDSYAQQTKRYKPPIAPHREKLAQTLAEMREKCDIIVVLFDGGLLEAQYLAKEYQPDILITNDRIRLQKPKKIDRTYLGAYGSQGKYLMRMDYKCGPQRQLVLQISKLYSILVTHPYNDRVHDLVEKYTTAMEELKSAQGSTSEQIQHDYLGYESCTACHARQYNHWANTFHAEAYEAMVESGGEETPEQMQRVVTGWKASGGFVDSDKTAYLLNVQCESCHGPGRAHHDSERLAKALISYKKRFHNRKFKETARVKMQTDISIESCVQCHSSGFAENMDSTEALKRMDHSKKPS